MAEQVQASMLRAAAAESEQRWQCNTVFMRWQKSSPAYAVQHKQLTHQCLLLHPHLPSLPPPTWPEWLDLTCRHPCWQHSTKGGRPVPPLALPSALQVCAPLLLLGCAVRQAGGRTNQAAPPDFP